MEQRSGGWTPQSAALTPGWQPVFTVAGAAAAALAGQLFVALRVHKPTFSSGRTAETSGGVSCHAVDRDTGDERTCTLPGTDRLFSIERLLAFGGISVALGLLFISVFSVILIGTGISIAATGLQPYSVLLAPRAFLLVGVDVVTVLVMLAAAWWALFRAGDCPVRRAQVTPAGLTVWPVYGRGSIRAAWAEVKTIVLAHRPYARQTHTTLRIQRAGHGRWLAVSDDMPGFADLLLDVRRHAPRATYHERAERGVIWRRHLLAGVVVATQINPIVSEAVYPSDVALLSVGLSVLVVVLVISPIAWTYVRPGRAQPTQVC